MTEVIDLADLLETDLSELIPSPNPVMQELIKVTNRFDEAKARAFDAMVEYFEAHAALDWEFRQHAYEMDAEFNRPIEERLSSNEEALVKEAWVEFEARCDEARKWLKGT